MDIFMSEQDIRNVSHNHAHKMYMEHANDAMSVRTRVEENKHKVF